jgi:hypothetical protein
MFEGEGEREFRNRKEFWEFDGTRSVTSRSVILNDDRVPGLDGTGSGSGTDSAMLNIAE